MLNEIVLAGRLTKDPEKRMTQGGTSVCSFSLACERDVKQNGERQTDFIDCVTWGRTADFTEEHFQKGMLAIVKGRLQMNKFTDRDGNNRTAPEVNVDRVYFGESKRSRDPEERPPVPSDNDAPPVREVPTARDIDELNAYENVKFSELPPADDDDPLWLY